MMRRRSDLPPADPQPWSEMIPPDSFYARLAKWRDVLVDDEDYAALYKDSPRGRPSIPPSMVVLAMLLQYHDDCSDAQPEARMRFDLRWIHALGLGLEDEGFDSTVLCRFRRKLLERGSERELFERLVNAAREAGLIAKDARQLLDSSHILGAVGARDTYTLIRGGIRKLLRSLGYALASRVELSDRLWWYIDPEAPEKPEIDWAEAEARTAHLKDIVRDAREALSLAEGATTTPATNEAAALLEKIVSEDAGEGPPPPQGPKRKGRPPNKKEEEPERPMSGQRDASPEEDDPRLRRGVAKDRVLSVVDPRMGVGHKSKRQTWAGYKVHIAEEPESELITQVGVRPANEYDADAASDLVGGQRESVGLRPRELLCDGAYGSADGLVWSGSYRAGTREHSRRIIYKAEVLQKGTNTRFVVSSRSDAPEELYDWYVQRAEAEGVMKDFKLALKADRLSCYRLYANQFRLLLHAAYWLLDALRTKLVEAGVRRMQLDTLRLLLIKIGGRVRELLTKVRLHLASGHPGQRLWYVLSPADPEFAHE